jgi:hypothetical protein
MNQQENLLHELEFNLKMVVSEYEKIFITEKISLDEFNHKYGQIIQGKIARLETDIIHEGLLIGVPNDSNFLQSVRELAINSVNELNLILNRMSD